MAIGPSLPSGLSGTRRGWGRLLGLVRGTCVTGIGQGVGLVEGRSPVLGRVGKLLLSTPWYLRRGQGLLSWGNEENVQQLTKNYDEKVPGKRQIKE